MRRLLKDKRGREKRGKVDEETSEDQITKEQSKKGLHKPNEAPTPKKYQKKRSSQPK